MGNDRPRAAWIFWLQWTLGNAVGSTIGWSVGWLISITISAILGNDVADAVMVAVIGALAGVAQWSCSRTQSDNQGAGRRALRAAGSAAAVVLLLSAVVVAAWFVGGEGYPSLLAIVGASMGLVQWFTLRRWLHLSGWWILASSICLAAGWSIAQSMSVAFHISVSESVGFAVMGGVIGLLIGILQSYFLRGQSRAGWWIAASTIAWASAMPIGFAAVFSWDAALAGAILGAITGMPLSWVLTPQGHAILPAIQAVTPSTVTGLPLNHDEKDL